MKNTYYVGSTIGPVYAVIQKARKPREIWMASYIFSRVAQEMVEFLKEKGAEFYSPTDFSNIAKKLKGAGAFSDRLFFNIKIEEDIAADRIVQEAMDRALTLLAHEIIVTLKDETEGIKDRCICFLRRFIYHRTVYRRKEKETDSIPMHEMTDELDLLEKFVPYVDEETKGSDYILRYLDDDNLKNSPWIKENSVETADFKELAEEAGTQGKIVNKYLAIVRADGDRMGELLARLSKSGKEESIRKLSNFLLVRAKENIECVKNYGGLPIFFGGDDMFFIAPLFGKDLKCDRIISIFELVKQLNKLFDDEYGKMDIDGAGSIVPSLSYGIVINYHKYPLQLMVEDANIALFDEAKNAIWSGEREKKAIHIHLRKHSGQESKFCLSAWPEKNDIRREDNEEFEELTTYDRFLRLIDQKADSITIRSIHWKIIDQFDLIAYLLLLPEETRKPRLKRWFEKNLNEWIPVKEKNDKDSTKKDKYIDDMVALLCAIKDSLVFDEEMSDKDKQANMEKIRHTLDGVFRMNEFLMTEEVTNTERREK